MKVHFVWAYRSNGDGEDPADFDIHSMKGSSALVEVYAPPMVAPTTNNTGNGQCICK